MRSLLLTALLCFCVGAYAANWKKIWENSRGDEHYIDLDSIENVKNRSIIFNIKLLQDYLEEQNDYGALSSVQDTKINCRTKKYKSYGELIFYEQQMGQGKILDRFPSIPFENASYEGSLSDVLIKYVCNLAN